MAGSPRGSRMVLRSRAIITDNDALNGEDTANNNIVQTPKRKLNRISKIQDEEEEEEFFTPPTSKKLRTTTTAPLPASNVNRLTVDSKPVVELPAKTSHSAEPAVLEGAGEAQDGQAPLPVRTPHNASNIRDPDAQSPDVSSEEDENDDKADKDGATDAEHNEQEIVADVIPSAKDTKSPTKLLHTKDERQTNMYSTNQYIDTTASLSSHRRTLPDLLPAELLQDNEEILSKSESEILLPIKGKKTKFVDEVNVTPKDRRVGTTTYRVAKPRSSELAPRTSAHSRSIKESWLQGRSGKKGMPNRKPFKSGFFVSAR